MLHIYTYSYIFLQIDSTYFYFFHTCLYVKCVGIYTYTYLFIPDHPVFSRRQATKTSISSTWSSEITTCLGFQYLPRLAHGIEIKGDHILRGRLKSQMPRSLEMPGSSIAKTCGEIDLVSASLKFDVYLVMYICNCNYVYVNIYIYTIIYNIH